MSRGRKFGDIDFEEDDDEDDEDYEVGEYEQQSSQVDEKEKPHAKLKVHCTKIYISSTHQLCRRY